MRTIVQITVQKGHIETESRNPPFLHKKKNLEDTGSKTEKTTEIEDETQHDRELLLKKLRRWLDDSNFDPERINLSDAVKVELCAEHPDLEDHLKELDVNLGHAIGILATIPSSDEERRRAVQNVEFLINWKGHGSEVFGIVCVHRSSVTIRFRHRISRNLEHATEELVSRVWDQTKRGGLFEEFRDNNSTIPVRESNGNNEVYFGRILRPVSARGAVARADKRKDIAQAFITFAIAVLCTTIGSPLFKSLYGNINDWTQWLNGFIDRLATAMFAAAAITIIGWRLHRAELMRKPIIDWSGV